MYTPTSTQMGIVQRTRKSPFYDATLRWGAQAFTTYNHMLMPIFYESAEADYWKLVQNVTAWDVACERQVEIIGPDALRLVRLLTPRNLERLRVGQCFYVPLCGADGGILNDPVLLRLGENHFWLSLADSDILLWAQGVAWGLGLDVSIGEPDVSPLAVQGPNAEVVAAALLGEWVRDIRYFWLREFDLDGIPLLVARSGWSKQGGFEFYLRDGSRGDELWERVMAAGAPWDIAPATPSGIERIENGLLSFGNDMTPENNPFEIGLERYCDLDQTTEFIGKAALHRIRAEGVRQKLVGLTLDDEKITGCQEWWPIWHKDERVGKLTSVAWSPRMQTSIGMGLVAVEQASPGTALTVQTPVGPVPATVTPMPFLV
jgi:glycine cleavage system aminomethyltransferase T